MRRLLAFAAKCSRISRPTGPGFRESVADWAPTWSGQDSHLKAATAVSLDHHAPNSLPRIWTVAYRRLRACERLALMRSSLLGHQSLGAGPPEWGGRWKASLRIGRAVSPRPGWSTNMAAAGAGAHGAEWRADMNKIRA